MRTCVCAPVIRNVGGNVQTNSGIFQSELRPCGKDASKVSAANWPNRAHRSATSS